MVGRKAAWLKDSRCGFALSHVFQSIQMTNVPWEQTTLLSLSRNSLARGLTMVVEGSSDFVTWTPLATSINGLPFTGSATISEGSGTVRGVNIATPLPGVATFYRLRVIGP